MVVVVLTVAGVSLFLILIYSFFTLALALKYNKIKSSETAAQKLSPLNSVESENNFNSSEIVNDGNTNTLPIVTIQLPIYNELYVVDRLLDAVVSLDYPIEKLHIQVLDDSTDDTKNIVEKKVNQLVNAGFDIQLLHRIDRIGFKAGALKAALPFAKGEFVAVFDADFVPQSSWLKFVLPHIVNNKIGMVQTKWGHLNRSESLLTQVQAMLLDMHFTVEQLGRNSLGHFINFNGTAGIWRKECIIDAGNWQGDTLTEDLDLSYRAQLKGWQFKYLEQVESPAELPATISACRSQQYRWNKGGSENFQKFAGQLLKNKTLSAKTKLFSYAHLLNSSLFLIILLMGILSVPLMMLYQSEEHKLFFMVSQIFGIATLNFIFAYWLGFKAQFGNSIKQKWNFIKLFIVFLCIAMGFAVNNSLAVIMGHLRVSSPFVRTPKYNQVKHKNIYMRKSFNLVFWLEVLLLGYLGYGIYMAVANFKYGLASGIFIFMCMFFVGLLYLIVNSILEKR